MGFDQHVLFQELFDMINLDPESRNKNAQKILNRVEGILNCYGIDSVEHHSFDGDPALKIPGRGIIALGYDSLVEEAAETEIDGISPVHHNWYVALFNNISVNTFELSDICKALRLLIGNSFIADTYCRNKVGSGNGQTMLDNYF